MKRVALLVLILPAFCVGMIFGSLKFGYVVGAAVALDIIKDN